MHINCEDDTNRRGKFTNDHLEKSRIDPNLLIEGCSRHAALEQRNSLPLALSSDPRRIWAAETLLALDQ